MDVNVNAHTIRAALGPWLHGSIILTNAPSNSAARGSLSKVPVSRHSGHRVVLLCSLHKVERDKNEIQQSAAGTATNNFCRSLEQHKHSACSEFNGEQNTAEPLPFSGGARLVYQRASALG